jgi:GntR family transcriptional regulator, transcriptional repressor for pyruvate dehydrogenase complex
MIEFPVRKKRESAVELVIGSIKELILTKQLRPGDRLPVEMDLAAALGVGRGSIREAMKILSALGIIEIRQGDGTYVAKSVRHSLCDPLLFDLMMSETNGRELVELRLLLEAGIARMIIERASDSDLAAVEQAAGSMATLVADGVRDPKQLAEADLQFHHALARATHNELVQKIYSFVLEFFAPYVERSSSVPDVGSRAIALHAGIIAALKQRDLAMAAQSAEASLQVWRELFSQNPPS